MCGIWPAGSPRASRWKGCCRLGCAVMMGMWEGYDVVRGMRRVCRGDNVEGWGCFVAHVCCGYIYWDIYGC